jgi:hypothetical protein
MVQRSDATLHARLVAFQGWLDREVGDEGPAAVIDPRCRRIRRAFEGDYRWRSTGGQQLPDVVANAAASLVDALTYALVKLSQTGAMTPGMRREIMGPKVLRPPD